MTRAKPRAKAKRRVKSERKSATTSEAAALQADTVPTPGLTLERPAAVPPDEIITTMPPLSAETHDTYNSMTTGDNKEQGMHEVDESNESAGAVDATTHEDSASHHAETLLTTATTAAEDTERAVQPGDNATSETEAMALAIGRLKAQLTAPFMVYDHNTHSIVPNPLYQRGAALRRALIASQSTLLHILREARAQAAQLTPKELLYHMQRAVLYICAQGLSLTSDMVTTTTTSTSSPDTTSATSSELGGALDGLWCMSSDATVAGQLPALESALARRDASAIAVLVTSAALSEGGGQEELQQYMVFLRARLSEEQDPAMQSKRSAEERAALQATVNNVNDMATLQSALSVAYKSIQPSQPLQFSGTESQGMACGATMSAEANARSVALLLQGYYNVLQWVLAVERDRAALRQSRVGVSGSDEVTAGALPTLQSRVEEYDPFTGRLVLKRTTPQSPWGLLTNMQGCLIGIENTLRNASPAGEQLYHVLQSAAPPSSMTSSASIVSGATHNNNNTAVTSSSDYGFPILQANRRRIRPPQLTQAELQAQQYDIVRRLCDSLAQPETTLHLVIQKRSQAELTAAHEVLFELAAQGAEQSAGQRVVLILQRALTSIPWGITLNYQSGSPALLTDFSSKLQLSDKAKNFLFDRRGQLRVLQINYVDTRRLPSASAMQELLAHSLLLALQLQVIAPPSQHNVTKSSNNTSATTAISSAVAVPVAGRGASLAKADTSNTPLSSSSSAATTTAPSLDAAADAIMKEMLAARHNSQAAVSSITATAATQAPSLLRATNDAAAKELTAAGEEEAVTAAEQAKKQGSKRTPRANATTATPTESEDVAHDGSHATVLEGHEWAAIPSTPPSRQAEGATAALQVSSSAVKGSSKTKSSNDSSDAIDSVNEEDARHRELLEEYGIADPSDDPPQQAQVDTSGVAVTQTGQTDAVTDVDALTADVLAEVERSPSLDDADEDEAMTMRRQKTAKKAKAAKGALPEEIEGGGDAINVAEEETRAATASSDKSTRKSAKKEKAKKGKAKKKKSKRERKSKTSKQAAEEDETSKNDKDEADDEANEVAEEAADGVEAHTADAAASDTKAAGALPQQADAETDKQLETRDVTVATKSQREKPAKQTRSKASRRAAGETATPVAFTQREFAGEVAALLREMPTDHTDDNRDSNNAATVKEATNGGDALGATPLVASKSTAEVALEVAASNSKTKKKKASSSNEGTAETSVTSTATLPEPSLVELVEASPLTFDNAVQLTSFDGAEAHFHRTQTSQPWEIKLAFEHNDLYVTQLPPANTATTRRHPFLRYLKPDAKGAGKWMVEQVNGTNMLEMTKEQKAPFVNMLRKATDVRFVLRALKR